jgi:hypothetical protein
MKLKKKLRKKIQQLEKRLREGPEKLARLKRKLQQVQSAEGLKAARKSAARVSANRPTSKASTSGEKPRPENKVKRKLNLSPEGRAKLSAAMKARWAAKRAADANAASYSADNQQSPPAPPQPPQNRGDGV